MEYKYIIHLSEDLAQHEEAVRKILAFDDNFKGEEDDYLLLCENWFSFKRFMHPGQAIEYYEREKILPDLKIQDIDFTELKDKKNVPEQYRKNTSGIIEIEYVLRMLDSQKIKRICLFIPYSGKLEDTSIVETLNNTGWLDKTINKVEEVVKIRILKDNQPILKLKISEALKELARFYFEKLDEGERNRLGNIVHANSHENWKHCMVKFENYDFPLRKMLIGFGDTENMTPKDIGKIVKYLLETSSIKISFLGWWKEGEVCGKLLNLYWKDIANYPRNKRIINLRTLDFALEIMKFHEDKVFEETGQVDISKNNLLYKIGYKPNGIDKERVFIDKLIGRRAAVAVSYIYESEADFDFANACSLITRGKTNAVSNLDDLVSKTISEYLGLKREGKKVIVHQETIMREEMEFINSYVIHLTALRNFLTDYEPSTYVMSGFSYNYEDYFLDLSSFNEFVFAYQKALPDNLPKLITEIVTNISSDSKYKGAEKILQYSNILFL